MKAARLSVHVRLRSSFHAGPKRIRTQALREGGRWAGGGGTAKSVKRSATNQISDCNDIKDKLPVAHHPFPAPRLERWSPRFSFEAVYRQWKNGRKKLNKSRTMNEYNKLARVEKKYLIADWFSIFCYSITGYVLFRNCMKTQQCRHYLNEL